MSSDQPNDWLGNNQRMWDERAPIHAASAFYDLASLRAGADPLREFEPAELGPVTGRRLLHLQCHIGTDTVGWARRGATVTGLDFSAAAVDIARELAAELGHDTARFVQSDLYSAPAALSGATFDIVYTGIGALFWLPDLTRWAQTVAALLAPGGVLYLVEMHPIGSCLGEGGLRVVEDYFRPEPFVYDEPGTYADYEAVTEHNLSVGWQHSLGSIVSAVATAGLRLEFLHEFDFSLFQAFPGLVRSEGSGGAAVFRPPAGQPRLPLLYSLRATKTD